MAIRMEDEAEPSLRRRLWAFLKTTRGRFTAALVFVLGAIATALVNYLLPGGVEALVQRSPVAVVVEADADNIDVGGSPVGGSYIVGRPIEDVGRPPNNSDDCVGRFSWARGMKGWMLRPLRSGWWLRASGPRQSPSTECVRGWCGRPRP